MNTIIGSELYVLSSKGALHIACIGGKLERHQPLVQVWTSCCATFTHVPCRLAVWHMQMCPGKLQVRSYALYIYIITNIIDTFINICMAWTPFFFGYAEKGVNAMYMPYICLYRC